MSVIVNTSTSTTFYGTVWEVPVHPSPPAAWELAPGAAIPVGSPVRTWSYGFLYKHAHNPDSPEEPFWKGFMNNPDLVNVNPEDGSVQFVRAAIETYVIDDHLEFDSQVFHIHHHKTTGKYYIPYYPRANTMLGAAENFINLVDKHRSL